ncbi:MAG: trigger factor [Thiogranum sp.]|nr:trigger factor [Thiogranum sp.]
MQVSVETTSGLGRRMTIQLPAEQIDNQVENKLQQLSRSVRIDGFRPGKVPLSVVKKRYGEQVRQETAGELMASSYEQALQQENIRPVGQPTIEQTRNEPGQELEFVATFEVYPEVEPPQLGDITIERPVAEISESDVDNMFSKLRKQRATWSPVERAAVTGDRLEIDFEGTIDSQPFQGNAAKNVPLELGSGAMIPGFEEQLTGLAAGEQKTIDVTFPENYQAQEMAGKQAQFAVSVNSVAEPVLPELDDEFARAFGVGEGGLEQLREEVTKNMRRELDAMIKSRVKQQVFDALLQKADIEVPASLIDAEVDALVKKAETGADSAGARDDLEAQARRRVSLGLLISEIIKRNQLQIDSERVRQVIEDLAQSYEKPEEVVNWYYSNQEMLSGIQTMVMEETVVDWIASQAQVQDKSYTFDELMKA